MSGEKFSESSIDVLVCAFTKTNDWEEYLLIKENLIYTIKQIVEKNNGSFAFPSSFYLYRKKLILNAMFLELNHRQFLDCLNLSDGLFFPLTSF